MIELAVFVLLSALLFIRWVRRKTGTHVALFNMLAHVELLSIAIIITDVVLGRDYYAWIPSTAVLLFVIAWVRAFPLEDMDKWMNE